VIYPNERDIQDFMAKLPCEIIAEFKPLVEEAQREYRRARLKDPANEEVLISVLSGHAGDVFKTLVARRLKTRSGDFVSFQREIGSEGGDAETAMWFAHDLYRLSGDGRMLAVWHRQIEPKVWRLERQAADMWWLPDMVSAGWETILREDPGATVAAVASGAAEPPESGNPQSPDDGGGREPRRAPADFFEDYRAKNPTMSYDMIAGRIGISRDTLFTIKNEKAWVRDYGYQAAAQLLGCHPADLHPCGIPKTPRRARK
jgi:hypothetical protein